MKLAYLVNQYPHTTHTFIRREIKSLEERGFEIHRFALRCDKNSLINGDDLSEYSKTKFLTKTRLDKAIISVVKTALFSPRTFCKGLLTSLTLGRRAQQVLKHLIYFIEACIFREMASKADCEMVHAHFGTNSTSIALISKILGGPQYSFTVHGPEEFDLPRALSLDLKIQHAEFVIGVSDFGRSQLCRWARVEDWEKLHVVRCAISPSDFDSQQITEKTATDLVSVGRIAEQKGQLVLIEALSILKQKNGFTPSIEIIGDGPLKDTVESRVRQYGLSNQVRLTGWQPQQAVTAAIASSRIFVLPSFAEGLPVVIMEAFALSRPVITTYIAGIPELVKHNENGWLVPAGNAEQLAIQIESALQSPNHELFEMGVRARNDVARLHNSSIESAKLAHLFKKSIEALAN
jgi:glycosyltransferase involved in cell wall biosynthesis